VLLPRYGTLVGSPNIVGLGPKQDLNACAGFDNRVGMIPQVSFAWIRKGVVRNPVQRIPTVGHVLLHAQLAHAKHIVVLISK